jgi:subtilisin family serine protease
MSTNPVQVILNTRDYFTIPDSNRGGHAKDFFEGRNEEFAKHQGKLLKQVYSIQTAFQQSGLRSGVVKVTLRRDAWAKSHRPQRSLFPPDTRPCVAASNLGELFYSISEEDLTDLQERISAAEPETRYRESEDGSRHAAPSNQRSEVGAVESIELPRSHDKRRFSVEEAVEWLSDPRTSSAYFVEFFSPPTDFLPELARQYFQRVTSSILSEVTDRGLTVDIFPVDIRNSEQSYKGSGVFGIKLISPTPERIFVRNAEAHSTLLGILGTHPYVRRITLPPIISAARLQTSSVHHLQKPLPGRNANSLYPKVGIIDGGVAQGFGAWRIGAHEVIAPDHQDLEHGSFIAGLLIGAQNANSSSVYGEPDGCDLFDISILPDTSRPATFETYYPKGIVDFLEELDAAVETAHQQHSVRVFNMSLNLLDPVADDSYGIVASLLDRIADRHDVVFVISAGNLAVSEWRTEWSENPNSVLHYLASRNLAEALLQPAESSRSIAVGALNPPGCASRLAGVPAPYSRRGPGLRVGVKPDVSHYGGAVPNILRDTGLQSWNAKGELVSGHGTSYAAPLVAKSLALLESYVNPQITREMLIALLVHGCELPTALRHRSLREIARQFAGFGVPKTSRELLLTNDHDITLVFSDTLKEKAELKFNFAWPASLVDYENGACRGEVSLTLVYRPPLNRDFGSEFVRINLDAHLRQEDDGEFTSRMKQAFLPEQSEDSQFEYELVRHGLKWWPTKVYRSKFEGIGQSSNWQIALDSLIRAGEKFPREGVPFALVFTISDPKKSAPVFNELRFHLTSRNVQIADIRTNAQIRIQP